MKTLHCLIGRHSWIYEGRTVFVGPLRYDYRCEHCWRTCSLPEPLAEADRDVRYISSGSPEEGYSTVIDFGWITDYRHRTSA